MNGNTVDRQAETVFTRDMTTTPRKYAVMADPDSLLNTYDRKSEATNYLAECAAYAKSQGRTFDGFIAEWSEWNGRYERRCPNCRCTVRPATWHDRRRRGLCEEVVVR